MNKIILLISSIFAIACSKIPQPFYNGTPIPHYIDPYFNSMLSQFKQDAQDHNVEPGAIDSLTVIKFSSNSNEITQEETADCNYLKQESDFYHNFHKEINFKIEFKNLDPSLQYKIFLHEMGHCVYALVHDFNDSHAIMYYAVTATTDWEFSFLENNYFAEAQDNKNNWDNELGPRENQ